MASGKILVVDDDRNICELLRLYIEKEGFTVVIANDGRQALEVFESDKPDLIMLDIMLPELDGWQVCREIRKKSQCPIIMLTAKGEVFDKVLGLELGADVPYCLIGGTMLAEGIGEKLTELSPMQPCYVVLCKPPFAVSTKEVYQEIDSVPLTQRPDTDGMIKALESCDYKGVCDRLMNVMETVTATKRRQIDEIRSVLRENGADATLMSGSGPTVYGLFSDRIAADAAATILARHFSETFLTETVQ